MSFCLSKRLGHHGIISSLSSSFTAGTRCLKRRRAGSCRAIAWAGRYAAARSARPTSTTSRSPPKALSSIFGARRPKLPILSTYPRHNSRLHVSQIWQNKKPKFSLHRLILVNGVLQRLAICAIRRIESVSYNSGNPVGPPLPPCPRPALVFACTLKFYNL